MWIFGIFKLFLKKCQKFWNFLKENHPKSKNIFLKNFESSTHKCRTAPKLNNIDLTPLRIPPRRDLFFLKIHFFWWNGLIEFWKKSKKWQKLEKSVILTSMGQIRYEDYIFFVVSMSKTPTNFANKSILCGCGALGGHKKFLRP